MLPPSGVGGDIDFWPFNGRVPLPRFLHLKVLATSVGEMMDVFVAEEPLMPQRSV